LLDVSRSFWDGGTNMEREGKALDGNVAKIELIGTPDEPPNP
jgi:hypothetical protein